MISPRPVEPLMPATIFAPGMLKIGELTDVHGGVTRESEVITVFDRSKPPFQQEMKAIPVLNGPDDDEEETNDDFDDGEYGTYDSEDYKI